MTADRTLHRRLAAAALALGLMLAGAPPAGAHAVLVDSEPTEGDRVTHRLEVVVLRFDEAVQPVEVTVTSAGGADVAEAAAEQAGDAVRRPLGPLPEQATYTIAYRVLSPDEHIVTGQVTFDYAGPVASADAEDPEDPAGGPALVARLWPALLLAAAVAAALVIAVQAFRRIRTQPGER